MIMISGCPPIDPNNYFYAKGEPLFAQTTLHAFVDAGIHVSAISELLEMGIYLTTAIKCAKLGYAVPKDAVINCSSLLEKEIALFQGVKVIMLMGDVAINAINCIAKKLGSKRAIPSGPTYKIRNGQYQFKGIALLPSYLQAGPSFFIEKSKRKMIAEDIRKGIGIMQTTQHMGLR